MSFALFTIPVIIISLIFVLWQLFFTFRYHSKIFKIYVLILVILVYNQFLISGHQISFLKKITLYLTYTDALLFYLIPPINYIVFYYLLYKRHLFSYLNAKHFWPLIPGLIYSIYFNTLSLAEKQKCVTGNSCGKLPDIYLYILGTAGIFFYIILSLRLIFKFLKSNRSKLEVTSAQQIHQFIWILFIYLFLNICYLVFSVVVFESLDMHKIFLILLFMMVLMQYFILFYIKPIELRFTSNDINEEGNTLVFDRNNVEDESKIIDQLEYLMEKEQLYLDHWLNLATLAKLSGIPSYKLTLCVKNYFSMSIPEFINFHRIAHAKMKLLQISDKNIKIEYLAYECGYLTRSSFYSNFSKFAGCSPIQYLNRERTSPEIIREKPSRKKY